MKIDINVIENAAENLIIKITKVKEDLNNLPEPETFNIDKLEKTTFKLSNSNVKDPEEFYKILRKDYPQKTSVIYTIFADYFLNHFSYKEVKSKFDEKKDQSMSRIIEEHWKEKSNSTTQCLYVGSSHNIATRIQQHLGIHGSNELTNKKTFGLYLNTWLAETKDIKLTICIYKIDTENKFPGYLQILEDLLWEVSKPLFGKQGAR